MPSVFFMRQTIQAIPGRADPAARIDGCSEFAIFWRFDRAALRRGRSRRWRSTRFSVGASSLAADHHHDPGHVHTEIGLALFQSQFSSSTVWSRPGRTSRAPTSPGLLRLPAAYHYRVDLDRAEGDVRHVARCSAMCARGVESDERRCVSPGRATRAGDGGGTGLGFGFAKPCGGGCARRDDGRRGRTSCMTRACGSRRRAVSHARHQ